MTPAAPSPVETLSRVLRDRPEAGRSGKAPALWGSPQAAAGSGR